MKKKILIFMFIFTCMGTLCGCSASEAPSDKMPADITDKTWFFYDDVTAENLCLNLGSDNSFSYYCQCGEPVGDSDLYDKYEYNADTEIITLSGDDNEAVKKIKILRYNEYHLMLEIDNEIKDFVLEEMDTTSNFYAFEGEGYFPGYESRCTAVEIAEGKIVCGPVNYDPEGSYASGLFEEYKLAEECTISELSVHSFRTIQGEQEYEEFYNLAYKEFSREDIQALEDCGSGTAFLWFNDELEVEKILFHGATSVTADWIAVTVEAEDAKVVTQEQLDEGADKDGNWYEAAHLNEDGSIIYLMTKEQYEAYKKC